MSEVPKQSPLGVDYATREFTMRESDLVRQADSASDILAALAACQLLASRALTPGITDETYYNLPVSVVSEEIAAMLEAALVGVKLRGAAQREQSTTIEGPYRVPGEGAEVEEEWPDVIGEASEQPK
jgi:hypothetical protein